MLLQEVLTFLQNVPPFQFLDDAGLNSVAGSVSMEFYPKDTVILRQNGPASESLRIIKKGAVRISMEADSGEDMVLDYRGEGESFGLVSLMGKDKQKTTIVAIDDTICYLVHKDKLYKLLDENPVLTEYFLQSHLTKYMDKTCREMRSKSLFYGSSDHILFTTQIGEIATKEVVTATEETSIQEAAHTMAMNRISSLVIIDGSGGLPSGIVTDRDLREKVVSKARDVREPVKNIMSLPLIRVDARDYCFEAVLKMLKYNIHHVLVIK
ncbi:MAG TPA: CBS domain-containing protein, partial [Dissulfurispiraceae bacterium]